MYYIVGLLSVIQVIITIIYHFKHTITGFCWWRMRINCDGNVGIGITNPQAGLHVLTTNTQNASVNGSPAYLTTLVNWNYNYGNQPIAIRTKIHGLMEMEEDDI